MKSLKEFIAENLGESTITTVQESTKKQVDENNNQKIIQEDKNVNKENEKCKS
ncbi:hypothetical protein [Chryseobacterium timonianum]|uniref:hypothetical protein n=1 Tax=Chryseobacterium timonianum TaxID=1805473 RepID=UPI001F4AB1FB|nr:hypothetical protein [Chryseobacterium timonianum]